MAAIKAKGIAAGKVPATTGTKRDRAASSGDGSDKNLKKDKPAEKEPTADMEIEGSQNTHLFPYRSISKPVRSNRAIRVNGENFW